MMGLQLKLKQKCKNELIFKKYFDRWMDRWWINFKLLVMVQTIIKVLQRCRRELP